MKHWRCGAALNVIQKYDFFFSKSTQPGSILNFSIAKLQRFTPAERRWRLPGSTRTSHDDVDLHVKLQERVGRLIPDVEGKNDPLPDHEPRVFHQIDEHSGCDAEDPLR